MRRRQGLAAILAAVTAMALLGGCGGNDESSQTAENRQSESTQDEQTSQETGNTNAGTENEDVPTIVIYNNSGAFSVSGAEAGSDEAAYKEMQD